MHADLWDPHLSSESGFRGAPVAGTPCSPLFYFSATKAVAMANQRLLRASLPQKHHKLDTPGPHISPHPTVAGVEACGAVVSRRSRQANASVRGESLAKAAEVVGE